jgi:DNA-binding transcriptional LysR family regulator
MQHPKATDFNIDIAADLQKWRTFVAIGELGSLTRAALFLDSNQSLLSRQLNALERECGARLFNRTGRGVELSEVGERLFPQVKALLAEAQRLENEIRGEAREPSGRVTLGFLPSIAQPLVGRLFSEVRSRHPAVSLKVLEGSSGQVEEWLADARVDIAILYRYGPTLPETEQSLAVVDSYLIGAPGCRQTAGPDVAFAASKQTRCRCRSRWWRASACTPCCRCTRCGAKWPMAGCRRRASRTRLSSARWRWRCPSRRGPPAPSRRWRPGSSISWTRWRAPAGGGAASRPDRGGIAGMRAVA